MKTSTPDNLNALTPVSVTIGAKGYQTNITAGKHAFVLDEPASVGGTDAGPKPQDMILSALGACTAITLRMYADRKGWPLEKVEMNLQFEPAENKDGEKEELEVPEQLKITGEVLAHGNLTPEQIKRLDVIAHKCPIHKALLPAYSITINTTLAAPEFQ